MRWKKLLGTAWKESTVLRRRVWQKLAACTLGSDGKGNAGECLKDGLKETADKAKGELSDAAGKLIKDACEEVPGSLQGACSGAGDKIKKALDEKVLKMKNEVDETDMSFLQLESDMDILNRLRSMTVSEIRAQNMDADELVRLAKLGGEWGKAEEWWKKTSKKAGDLLKPIGDKMHDAVKNVVPWVEKNVCGGNNCWSELGKKALDAGKKFASDTATCALAGNKGLLDMKNAGECIKGGLKEAAKDAANDLKEGAKDAADKACAELPEGFLRDACSKGATAGGKLLDKKVDDLTEKIDASSN